MNFGKFVGLMVLVPAIHACGSSGGSDSENDPATPDVTPSAGVPAPDGTAGGGSGTDFFSGDDERVADTLAFLGPPDENAMLLDGRWDLVEVEGSVFTRGEVVINGLNIQYYRRPQVREPGIFCVFRERGRFADDTFTLHEDLDTGLVLDAAVRSVSAESNAKIELRSPDDGSLVREITLEYTDPYTEIEIRDIEDTEGVC